MQERVEIVCLKYKEPEIEWKCAKSIIENTNYPFKLVFYDVRGEEINMPRFFNKFIRESTCQYVMMLDADTEVWPGWLEEMMKVYETIDKETISTVVPRTNLKMNYLQTECKETDGILEGDVSGLPAGFCNLYRRSVFEKVGLFDENFPFFNSDTEWFYRAQKMGLKWYIQPKAFVYHLGSYTTNKAMLSGDFPREKFLEDEIKSTKFFNEKYKI